MKRKKERRKSPREILPRSEVGIVYPQYDEDELDAAPKDRRDTLLVDVLNWSESGFLFESHVPFKVGSLLDMRIRLPHKKVWIPFRGRVVWVDKSPNKRNNYRLGVELHRERQPGKAQFDAPREDCPDLQNFLTDLVTHRFSKESVTADRTVGKYVVNEIIAEGGWSIVYKGTHKTLNMPVAIKMLKHDMAMDPDFSERFRYEAKTIARLKHENIVRIYDIEELCRTIFIIMEYLEGSPLDHILEKMPKLPLSRALAILLQVCAALGYAHKRGIVHQDIKPGNIFIQANDRTKIVDFGLACPRGAWDPNLPGTLFYMAPEQIEGESVDERTDIYCLGITAFEMITGQRPFPKDEITKVMDLHLHEDVPDARTLIPDLPDELHSFIMRATQRNPAARHRSMSQALHDLEPLAEKMGLSGFLKTV